MTPADLDPWEAIEMYLADREAELRDSTLESHEYRLVPFARFCDEQGLALADLDGRDLQAFKQSRVDDVAPKTLQSQMSTLRQFTRFLESIEAVPSDLSEKVRVPSVEQVTRESRIERDRAERILDYLGTYEYASRNHAMFAFAWHTGARLGGIRAVDLRDCALDDDEQPHVKLRHRTGTDTPLKNGDDGERNVGLKPWCASILRDYVDERRAAVADDHGREALFTTPQGRISENYLRVTFYHQTHPCAIGQACPHDRDEADCEALKENTCGAQCPDALPPHDVRRGSISDHLQRGWPIEDLAERVNASPKVIRAHYDVRGEREAMLARSTLLSETEESNA
jgi:site-specific recombinase XerD